MPSKPYRYQIWISGGLALISLMLYGQTLAPTLLLGDGGEFQFVPWLPGIAHPTGYPFYTLLGWGFSRLFVIGEVAWRLNLFSALLGVAAVVTTYHLACRFNAVVRPQSAPVARQLAAVAAALSFAFSQTFWSQAVIAEVYTLHALLIALILLLTLQVPPAKDTHLLTFGQVWLLALLFGLGLAHHRTTVLLFPAMFLALWLQGYRRLPLRDIFLLGGVTALPLLLYFYLPLIAPYTPYAQLSLGPQQTLTLYENSLAGFVAHISGQVFSSELQPEALGWGRLGMSLDFLWQNLSWAGVILGLAGLWALRRRPLLLALSGGSLLSLWAFNLIYFIGDIEVLFIPCWLIWSVWLGVGGLTLSDNVSRMLVAAKTRRPADGPLLREGLQTLSHNLRMGLTTAGSSLLLLLPLALLMGHYSLVDQSDNRLARDAWTQILAMPLAENAVLLSNDRNEMMPLWYLQYVEDQRPDVLGLFPLITPEPAFANVGRVLDQALASGRPVYLIKPMPGLALKANLEALPPQPLAQVFRAQLFTEPPVQTTQHRFGDELRLQGYTLRQQPDHLAVTLFWQVIEPPSENYTTYVHLIDAAGQGRRQSDQRPGGEFYPSRLWQAGEILRDQHRLSLPPDMPPGTYTVLIGVYHQPTPGRIEALGEAVTLTQIEHRP